MAKFLTWTVLAICLVRFGVGPASAQTTQTFMLVPGVPGDAVADRYEGWIDVYSITQTHDPSIKRANACSLEVAKRDRQCGASLVGRGRDLEVHADRSGRKTPDTDCRHRHVPVASVNQPTVSLSPRILPCARL